MSGRTYLPQSYVWEDISASVIHLGGPFCLSKIPGRTFLPQPYIWEDLSASVIACIWEDQAYVIQNICLYPYGMKSMIQRKTICHYFLFVDTHKIAFHNCSAHVRNEENVINLIHIHTCTPVHKHICTNILWQRIQTCKYCNVTFQFTG